MGIHDGHRDRMRKRFIQYGLDNFDDHNVLELLLFYALPRRDLNPLAHALLERFGGLDGVFEATMEELLSVPGLGESAASLIRLIPQVSRRYMMARSNGDDILDSSAKVGEFFVPRFMYEKDEVVYLVCLDSKCKLISCREISRGVVNSAEVSVRRIVELALSQNASSVLIAHNHAGGLAIPSREDEVSTGRIKKALALVGITLADHVIVSGEDYVSMVDSGMLNRV